MNNKEYIDKLNLHIYNYATRKAKCGHWSPSFGFSYWSDGDFYFEINTGGTITRKYFRIPILSKLLGQR